MHNPSGDIEEGGSIVAVVSSCTCLAVTQVPCIHPHGLLLLYLPCVESIGLMFCGRPYGELLGSGAALQKLKGLQRLLAEKCGLAIIILP